MEIITHQGLIKRDAWQLNTDDERHAASHEILSLERWCKWREEVAFPIAPLITGDDAFEELAVGLTSVPLIAVSFPNLTDGRGYSIAYALRKHYRFAGDLRAIGDIQRDQMAYLVRAGFSSFEIDHDQHAEDLIRGLTDTFSHAYQTAVA
ncbi:MAG: DUF934 domain-containing protein [Pseudomonadota bacterium]